eukprot:3736553-Pleurochrysis_carterae.AAC.1
MARRLIGGQDGRGTYRVFQEETMELAHDEKYAGHPILKLFTRPEELENGTYMHIAKEDIAHVNEASGNKPTCDILEVALALHKRYDFHLAVAADGAKKGK